jgi:hypothetical protein
VKCRSLVFTAPCFVDLSSYFYVSLSHPRSEREKVRAKRGADDASWLGPVEQQQFAFIGVGDRVQVCACRNYHLFLVPPMHLSVSFAFFLVGESHLSRNLIDEKTARKRDRAHSQISPSFHPAAQSAMANTPNCFIALDYIALQFSMLIWDSKIGINTRPRD